MLFSTQGVLIILVIALLLFGPEKLPEIGRVVGRFMAEFKRAQEAVEATIRAEMYQHEGLQNVDATPAAGASTAAPAFSGASSDEDEEEDEE